MMIDEFGNEYKEYMRKTGRLIPHLISYLKIIN